MRSSSQFLILCLLYALPFGAMGGGGGGGEESTAPAVYGITSYANYSQPQCFELAEATDRVDCLQQMLNITDPPSIYGYAEYNALWEPVSCLISNVTLDYRYDDDATFNYCAVPRRGFDAFLFVSLALLFTAVLFGRLAAVFVLVAGGILGLLNYYVNLLQVSNAISLWLSIQPADLFFYAFLPPLLLDQAIHIDFFMFRKIWVHSLLMAFVMVVLSAIALTPFILFVLGFASRGWSWVHGALMAAIIAPTDALAVAAILARANGPERLVAVMEGECLFNDASAITLFEVFAHLIYEHATSSEGWPSVWSVVPTILLDILRLSGVGLAIGLAFSLATAYLLRWLRWRGARPYIETTVILAVAYLSFYVANSPARGSGVIAVVVFGLHGNATSKWGMLATAEESGAFGAVFDMISFAANGLVFFWSGVASVNFFIRSVALVDRTFWSYAAIPLIYLFMVVFRSLCVGAFNPIFRWLGEGLSPAEIFFVGWAGLRGSVSLIMMAAYTSGTRLTLESGDESTLVNADISLWVSAFVVLTLVINGPTIAPILRLLRLNIVPVEKLKMRARAKRALCRFTDQQLASLREDDDEFLQGANWDAVSAYVDMSGRLEGFDPPEERKGKGKGGKGGGGGVDGEDDDAPDTSTAVGVWRTIGRALFSPVLRLFKPGRQRRKEVEGVTNGLGGKKKDRSVKAAVAAPPARKPSFSSLSTESKVSSMPKTSPSGSSGDGGSGASPAAPNAPASPGDSLRGGTDVAAVLARHEKWEDLSATELAAELHDECPFLVPTAEEGASGAPGGLQAVGDIEMGGAGSGRVPNDPVAAAAAAAEALDRSGSSLRGRTASDLAPITEGVPAAMDADDPDQACLTGAAGAKLLQELRRSMSSSGASGALVPPDHYASLPPAMGAKLKAQLAEEMAKASGSGSGGGGEVAAAAAPDAVPPSPGGGPDPEADYYCSLPALAGKALQEQLRAATSGTRPPLPPAPAPSPPPAALAPGAEGEDLHPEYYASLPAAVGRSLQEELQRRVAAGEADQVASELAAGVHTGAAPVAGAPAFGSTTSLPAAAGRALQAELQAHLSRSSAGPNHSRAASADLSAPSSSRSLGPRVSGGRPSDMPYSYHATVTGVSGSNLASELRQHLRSAPMGGPSERDLLGRKKVGTPPATPRDSFRRQQAPAEAGTPRLSRLSSSSASAAPPALPSRLVGPADTPMARALLDKKNSNLHALRRTGSLAGMAAAVPALSKSATMPSASSGQPLAKSLTMGPSAHRAAAPLGKSKTLDYRRSVSSVSGGDAGGGSGVGDHSAALLARTFSVGASLHKYQRRPSPTRSSGAAVAERGGSEVDEDGEEESTGGRGTYGPARTISATTLRDASFRKDLLGGMAADGEGSEATDEDAEMVTEMRVRVLAGLKRHFVGKRLAGLLSVEGLRILEYACDVGADRARQPFRLWAQLEREVSGGWILRGASRLSLATTRGYRALHPKLQRALSWPFKQFASALRRLLGRKMLVACEVAVEYYLALLGSPQIQWLKGHGEAAECWRLLEEVEAEAEAAHRFIIEREIEAPDRFQAIQSYRAAMAVLRQQMLFVHELYETGMVDVAEERGLSDPIDRRLRHLELVGPVWRPPRPKNVLRSLPFMAALPDPAFRRIYGAGAIIEFRKGQCIWTATDLVRRTSGAQGPGGFVVLSGVVKRVYIRPDGGRREYFQGAGGVVGVLLAMTGTKLPGTELAIAEGNAMGKGPVVFHFTQSSVRSIADGAAAGDPDLAGLEEELARLSAAYIVESMEAEVAEAVAGHLEAALAPGAAARRRAATLAPLERASSAPVMPQLARRSVADGLASLGSAAALGGTASSAHATTTGLATSKSVGANLAAMMQQIAALEYEEDDEEESSDAEEGGEGDGGAMPHRASAPVHGSHHSHSHHSLHHNNIGGPGGLARTQSRSFAGGAASADRSVRPSSPPRRGVRFTSEDPELVEPPEEAAAAAEAEARVALAGVLSRVPQLAIEIIADIRRALHSAFVLRLEPGSHFDQTSHAVVISGGLIPADAGAFGYGTNPEKQQEAPAVLPWLWQDRLFTGLSAAAGLTLEEGGAPTAAAWVVGAAGATVVVAHNADGSVPEGVLDWERRVEELDRERRASELASFPIDGGGGNGMRRVPSVSGSEGGSLTGAAASAMKEQLGAVMSLLRRTSASVNDPSGSLKTPR